MGVQSVQAHRLVCDHTGCKTACPAEGNEIEWLTGEDATHRLQELCVDHWTIDDDDKTVERVDDVQSPARRVRPRVDPSIVTCAVRYALGRSSYMPGLAADEVRLCWDDLGDQQQVIIEDVRRWLADNLPAPWMMDRETWETLHQWMEARS